MNNILETAPIEVGSGGVDLLLREALFDLQYDDDIVLLYDDNQAMKIVHYQLTISVRMYGTYFRPKCKVLYKTSRNMCLHSLCGNLFKVVERIRVSG